LEFPYLDEWCNNYGDDGFQVVMDCADSYDKTKALFEAGTNGVTPVDQFDAYCQQRGSYEGSAWFKSWGVDAVHPECVLIDRDGYIRKHSRGWPGDAGFMEYEPALKKLLGIN